MIRFGVALLLLTGCATTGAGNGPGPAIAPIGGGLPEAKRLLESGDIAAAIAMAEQYTGEAPGEPIGFYTLGTLLSATNDWPGAAAALEECVNLDVNHGPAFNNLGLVRLEQDELTAARAALLRATSLMPGSADPWVNLAAVHAAGGAYGRASEALEEALQRSPDAPSIRLAHANALTRAGHRAVALRSLRKLETDPGLTRYKTEIAIGLSIVLRQMGKYKEAAGKADAALANEPGNVEAMVAGALARDVSGDFPAAEKLYLDALAAQPNNLDALYNYGAFLEEQGRKGKARVHFERYLEIDLRPSARRGHVKGRLSRMLKSIRETR